MNAYSGIRQNLTLRKQRVLPKLWLFTGLTIAVIPVVFQISLVVDRFPAYAYLVPAPEIIREASVKKEDKPRSFWVPYAFATESLGFAMGAAVVSSRWPQEQAKTVSTLLGSSNGSFIGFGYISNLQIPIGKRFFFDGALMIARYTELQAYVAGNPRYPNERPGSNESSADNYIVEKGWDSYLDLRFKYILPIARGRDYPINTYWVKDGFLVSGAAGGGSWNPLVSGRSWIEFKPFYRYLNFDFEGENPPGSSSGLELSLSCDNTDFFHNPTRGYMTRLSYVLDPGVSESKNSWTFIEGEFSKYFTLAPTKNLKQQVLAFNVWTGDSPTTEIVENSQETSVPGNPPFYAGARLGGIRRMRGYPQYRFYDRSVIYYALEYRAIPEWQPLKELFDKYKPLWEELDFNWWQFVGFAELGRVAPSWSLSDLHSNMKWSLGFGLRVMIMNTLLRLDMATSEEGGAMWAMVGHPF